MPLYFLNVCTAYKQDIKKLRSFFVQSLSGRLLFLSVLLHLLVISCQAGTIVYNNPRESYLVGKKVSYFRDDSGNLDINEVLSPQIQAKFRTYDKDVFTHPVTRGVFWFRLSIVNNSGSAAWLQLGTINARYIDFYFPDSSGNYSSPILTGVMRGEGSKVYPVNNFWLPVNSEHHAGPLTYYLRVREESPVEVPLRIGTLESLHRYKTYNDYLTAGFIGAILIMLLFNLFLWLSTRDRLYLIYVLYLFTSLLIPPAQNGYMFLSHFSFATWMFDHAVFFMAISNSIVGIFAIQYLSLRTELPKFYITLVILIGSLLTMGVLNLFFPYGHIINTFQVSLLLMFILCLVSGYILLFRKRKQAFFYSLGWTFMIIFTIIFILTLNGFIPHTFITRNATYFGISLEAWMFSLALGNRINVMKKLQEVTQKQLLEKAIENEKLVRTQNQILEEEVNRRTLELRKQSEALKNLNARLELSNVQLHDQAVNLEALNRTREKFFSIIAHDLKNPFNSILGFTQLLLKNLDTYSPDRIRLQVESIGISSKHAYDLLENLLEWGRMQSGEIEFNPVPFNLRQLVVEVVALLESQAQQKNIQITHHFNHDFEVLGDRNMISTVLRNLISNAVKFTNNGGVILIFCQMREGICEVTVQDNGVGMSEENLERLFRPEGKFNTKGTANEKGTGLGLILCKDFVEKNKGQISARSKQNEGSSFTFTIPVFGS
jgi:signal transduction histidine kinase